MPKCYTASSLSFVRKSAQNIPVCVPASQAKPRVARASVVYRSYRLTFDWCFSTLSQSEFRVKWWTHNLKNPTNFGRREFNSTLGTRLSFGTKIKALACEIPPARQASVPRERHNLPLFQKLSPETLKFQKIRLTIQNSPPKGLITWAGLPG